MSAIISAICTRSSKIPSAFLPSNMCRGITMSHAYNERFSMEVGRSICLERVSYHHRNIPYVHFVVPVLL